MKRQRPLLKLTGFEWFLWGISIFGVSASSLLGGNFDGMTLAASLIGVTALIFVSRGDVAGQVLTVVFSLFYAVISLRMRYYGEMITYLGMTAPIALLSVISWWKNPYASGRREVKVARLGRRKTICMIFLTGLVTVVFHYILAYFHTTNLFVSTISIATSFLASYLMLYRSPAYALAYGANDVVLIILWILATVEDRSYLSMVICFLMFFINDLYGFYNWRKMEKRQRLSPEMENRSDLEWVLTDIK